MVGQLVHVQKLEYYPNQQMHLFVKQHHKLLYYLIELENHQHHELLFYFYLEYHQELLKYYYMLELLYIH